MCEHGETEDVFVPIPADLSHTGEMRWAHKPVDRCIADLVRALNRHAPMTRSSCCGHGRAPGSIVLWDGRDLLILPAGVGADQNRELALRVHEAIFGATSTDSVEN